MFKLLLTFFFFSYINSKKFWFAFIRHTTSLSSLSWPTGIYNLWCCHVTSLSSSRWPAGTHTYMYDTAQIFEFWIKLQHCDKVVHVVVYSFIYKVLARLWHGWDMVVTSMSTTLLQPCHNFVVKVVATLYKLVISAWMAAWWEQQALGITKWLHGEIHKHSWFDGILAKLHLHIRGWHFIRLGSVSFTNISSKPECLWTL